MTLPSRLTPAYFKEFSYTKLHLLGRDVCAHLSQHYWANSHLHIRWPDLPGIKRMSVNNLSQIQEWHIATTPLIQWIVGEPIKPSYSFITNYERGSSLPQHTDRSQCKYNVTILLEAKPPQWANSWPLFFQHNGVTSSASLDVGEAVVYSGTTTPHWRYAMPENLDSVLALLLHYVATDFTGPLE
jgi:hypothetical protein